MHNYYDNIVCHWVNCIWSVLFHVKFGNVRKGTPWLLQSYKSYLNVGVCVCVTFQRGDSVYNMAASGQLPTDAVRQSDVTRYTYSVKTRVWGFNQVTKVLILVFISLSRHCIMLGINLLSRFYTIYPHKMFETLAWQILSYRLCDLEWALFK